MKLGEDFEMEDMAMGMRPDVEEPKLSSTDKRKAIADKMESLERFAGRIEECDAITAKQKKDIDTGIAAVREVLVGAYTK